MEIELHSFLTSASEKVDRAASHAGRFIPREKSPGTHQIGGLAGPMVWTFRKTEKSLSPDRLVRRLVTTLTELSRLPIKLILKVIITAYKHACNNNNNNNNNNNIQFFIIKVLAQQL